MKTNHQKPKRGNHDPAGHTGRQGRDANGGEESSARSGRKNAGEEQPQDSSEKNNRTTGSTRREGNSAQDNNRGYADMDNRSLGQDYNKNLDEDNMSHYESESGFEEFDAYADDATSDEGNDQEYNSRYNDDPAEANEKDLLHTDTETTQDLKESRGVSGKKKRKRLPSTRIAKKYGPVSQSERERDNQEAPGKKGQGEARTNGEGSTQKGQSGKGDRRK